MFHHQRDICTNVICTLITMWMTSFKVLGWVVNRGPLVRPLDAVQFVAVYAFPITPTNICQEALSVKANGANGDDSQGKAKAEVWRQGGRLAESTGGYWVSVRNFAGKILAAIVTVYVLTSHPGCPEIVKSFLYGFGLYSVLGMIMDGPAALATSAIGMQIAPHFDNPYTAHSLAEFWNKRWNLTAGNLLRFLVYDPINEGRLIHDPTVSVARSKSRRLVGMSMSFVVSGIMHEIMVLYLAHRFSGHMMTYFLCQPVVLVAEQVVKGQLKKHGMDMPVPIGWIYTVGGEVWLSHQFFFGGIFRDVGIPARFCANMADTGAQLSSVSKAVAGPVLSTLGSVGSLWWWAGPEL
ncbi:hypothetical protein N2152v2_008630 [Parachlorella kessleri]